MAAAGSQARKATKSRGEAERRQTIAERKQAELNSSSKTNNGKGAND